MNYRIEDELDKMINELNSVEDEFVTSYFNDETKDKMEEQVKEEIVELIDEPGEKKIETEEKDYNESNSLNVDTNEQFNNHFSYSQILNRLDNNVISKESDVIQIIEDSTTPDEFFNAMEEINND